MPDGHFLAFQEILIMFSLLPTLIPLSPQHIVYLTKFVLSYVIPDVPYTVREQIKREKYLSQVILHETNLKLVTKRLKPVGDKILKHNEDKEEEIMDLYF
jgi:hypothetical protein